MGRNLTLLLGALMLMSAVACGSTGEGGGGSIGQLADVSQFPTPSGSRATPEPTQDGETLAEGDETVPEAAPLTLEELQQIRQRLQSGELTQEEAQGLFQQLQGQLGRGNGAGALGGVEGRQLAGSIESIEQLGLTLTTETGVISVNLSDDTDISVIAVLDPAKLIEGTQVSAIVERVEGRNVARTISVILEGQGGFGPFQGDIPRGLGGPGFPDNSQNGQDAGGATTHLFGTVVSPAEGAFTLETQQGPLPITTDEESIVIRTGSGTHADLKVGMQVRVTGPSDEGGGIDAVSVVVIPEGLEDLPGLGRRGFGGGGALGGGPWPMLQ